MKTTWKVITLCTGLLLLASCVKNTKEYRKLEAENDSLKIESIRNSAELNEVLTILNEVEGDIQSIREAENFLTVRRDGEINRTRQQEIKDNMLLIAEMLKKNKEQINKLEQRLKKSDTQSSALRKTIERLNAEMDQKAQMISALQEDLARKNIRIEELDKKVRVLNEEVEVLSTTSVMQSQTLSEQDKELHRAYYCFGTTKELKDQKILTGGGLFSKSKALQDDFNRDYFTAIDIREVNEIPLYAHKARLYSNHPEDSYQFLEDADGNLILIITDTEKFWSMGKYLVIRVG